MMSEVSEKPLYQKLGFKPELTISILNEPANYLLLLGCHADEFNIHHNTQKNSDIIHCFLTTKSQLQTELDYLKSNIKQNGMIWISWPKKKSKILTDLNEDLIRKAAIENGLVDVKVCSVSTDWSALKLVIPLKLRSKLKT